MNLIKNTFLNSRLFVILTGVILLFTASFAFPALFWLAAGSFAVCMALLLADIVYLFQKKIQITVSRSSSRILSLGSDNHLHLLLHNSSPIHLNISIYEELPEQLQLRDLHFDLSISAGEKKNLSYTIHPTSRGEYEFGYTILFIKSRLGLAERKIKFPTHKTLAVYPSIIQMKQFELMTLSSISKHSGVTKLRRLGQSYELEHIKTYVQGDDFRSINWKATARKKEIMVNQFEEEKSQQIYCLLDCSRTMLLPFNGLSLLDYSINTSLVIANAAIHKQDKFGLISFSDQVNTVLNPDKNKNQLIRVLEALYNQEEKSLEANYELLYYTVKYAVKTRSLFFLFTNFESHFSLERVLPILRKLNALHLLVVIVFENQDVVDFSRSTVKTTEDIFLTTVAQKYVLDKKQILSELRKYGIQVIYTKPENLSINALNKYLELKSRGLI